MSRVVARSDRGSGGGGRAPRRPPPGAEGGSASGTDAGDAVCLWRGAAVMLGGAAPPGMAVGDVAVMGDDSGGSVCVVLEEPWRSNKVSGFEDCSDSRSVG